MNVAGHSEVVEMNVVPLFPSIEVEMPDPLQELLEEGETAEAVLDERPLLKAQRILVSENQFPDQSMYTLEKQLGHLRESLGRLRFYLSDLDDLLPR